MKNAIYIHTPRTAHEEERDVEVVLRLLRHAHRCAREIGCDPRQFAVELHVLSDANVSPTTLRWLALKGHVLHITEMTQRDSKRRSFRASPNLSFCDRSCFVLTKSGVKWADELLSDRAAATDSSRVEGETPFWDVGRRTLLVGDRVVKRFKYLASNQELVLIAFQAQGWPARIDDPLPLLLGRSRKRRLHDTIKKLNQSQVHRLIHFYGDGSGRGICWEIIKR